MNLNIYQQQATRTAFYPHNFPNQGLYYTALGLAGEAGEVVNKIKKVMRDTANELSASQKEAIVDELGDVLWYCAGIATELGIDLEKVARDNLQKLERRHT